MFPGEWLDRPEDGGTGAFVAILLICPLKIESSSFDFVGPVFEKISRRVTVGVAVLYACSAFCNSLSRIGRNFPARPPKTDASLKRLTARRSSVKAAVVTFDREPLPDACVTTEDSITDEENAWVHKTQKRAICAGNKSNCVRRPLISSQALRYPARNDGANGLLMGFVGLFDTASAKKHR